jgi:hypothetical protein
VRTGPYDVQMNLRIGGREEPKGGARSHNVDAVLNNKKTDGTEAISRRAKPEEASTKPIAVRTKWK